MPKNKLNPLSVSEAGLIRQMAQTDGWQIFERELKNRFEDKLKKLRRCARDSTFYKIQGYLDSIEEVFLIVQHKLEDIDLGEGEG